MWHSVEVHKLYTDSGGCLHSRLNLIKALKEQFCNLVVLSAPGYAHIITFPNKAASILRLCPDDGDDELNAAISKVAKQINVKFQLTTNNKEKYNLHVSHDNVVEETSMTLMRLCGALSTKLDKTPPALLIGSIVSATISNKATNLQIALGAKFRYSKEVVNLLNKFQISCTYDEVLRFKKSAAHEVSKKCDLSGISVDDTGETFIQIVIDNFDTEISSQNGKMTTHSLAVLVAQTKPESQSLTPYFKH